MWFQKWMALSMQINSNVSKNIVCIIFWGFNLLICAAIFSSISVGKWDDSFFQSSLTGTSLIDFISNRYYTWSGRVFIESILVTTINISSIPGLIISISFGVICFFSSKLLGFKGVYSIAASTLIMLLLLANKQVIDESVMWVSGGYNYVLPFSLGFVGLYGYKKLNSINSTTKLTYSLLLFFACNNEQFAVTSLIIISCSIFARMKAKEDVKWDYWFLLCSTTGAAIVFFSPGNLVRYASEVSYWYPSFSDYNILEKLSLSLDKLNNHLNDTSNILIYISTAVVMLSIINSEEIDRFDILMLSIVTLKAASPILGIYTNAINSRFYISSFVSANSWTKPWMYCSYFMSMLVYFSIVIHAMKKSKNNHDLFAVTLISLCGLISVVIMGFSPTVYASSTRTMFLFDISIAMLVLFIYKESANLMLGNLPPKKNK